jgi:hypothetical protein
MRPLGAAGGRHPEAVGNHDAPPGRGLVRNEIERPARDDCAEEARSSSDENGVHDEAKLIKQVSGDDAGDESRATDHVDGFAGCCRNARISSMFVTICAVGHVASLSVVESTRCGVAAASRA